MSLTATLAAGGLLGARHALEADHLAAVATLVDDEDDRPGLVGTSWGVGHSLPVVALGLLLVGLGVRVSEPLFGAFEALVGVILVALGVYTLLDVFDVLGVERHAHGEADGTHRHLRLGSTLLGTSHRHGHGGGFLGGFAPLSTVTMGVVAHAWGIAVSAGLTRILRATAGLFSVALGVALVAGL